MPKPFTVKDGNRSLKVSPHSKGWRFAYQTADGRKEVTRKLKKDITAAAEEILEEQEGGFIFAALPHGKRAFLRKIHDMTPTEDEQAATLAFLKARQSSSRIGDAVARFCAHKEESAGRRTRHLVQVRSILEAFAADHAGSRVSDLTAGEIEAWWRDRCRNVGPKRTNEIRGNLVTFGKWAIAEGMATSNPAQRLPAQHVPHGEKRIITPDELASVLNEVSQEFRAWVVLGAWAGLRPEEIVPGRQEGRRGLHIEEIDWDFSVIRVPAEVAGKVRRPRIIPMSPMLVRGLHWAGIEQGQTGPVVLGNPWDGETKRLGKLVFSGKWPADALRHSYGSYRNAILRDLGRVAEEMGTSVQMLHRHYHNPRAEDEGAAWFEGFTLGDRWEAAA